ncbi:magnesium chelatase, H subunit/cobaltochelatase, CobN subunit [Methanocella conradii HZ254]|uniref:Magnesium chelatase, H subunit/cobaltochelatase, CobN subunit n=1 Tax=Methanocella conradii (strain DSM 24694 / JCM 17849 / CGMCC 1.5162 / HZ254) TaxID=1041930 RepID=H8I8X3_METCZ|nr:cobaltochelatase subunit CobN [Methanocella conradii]AFD00444.1 magnesium chelatase, H subunit/cobaltochelatase, CobN subunit [Methanocella conradii HZ254]
MKITSIMPNAYISTLIKACEKTGFDLKIYSTTKVDNDPVLLKEAIESMRSSDIIFLHRGNDSFWDAIEGTLKDIGSKVPIVCLGYDTSYWLLSTVRPAIVATANAYLTINGEENLKNMMLYLAKEVLGMEASYEPPKALPWEGIYHPDADTYFTDVEKYLEWYKPRQAPTVGILFSRFYWANKTLEVENALIRALEQLGMNVLPVFSYSLKDDELGARGMHDVVKDYFIKDGQPRVDAIIKLTNFFIGQSRENMNDAKSAWPGVELFAQMNVPVFQPIVSSYQSIADWEASNGLNNDIGWSVAMPEFEGVIEPLIIGAGISRDDYMERSPIEERCSRLARRVAKWIALKNKPVGERKVAFILHNNPCASVEAAVGGAAHLDSIESVSRILHAMKDAGYAVEAPENGKALIDDIMKRKAISEFRWTTVESIVQNGGVLAFLSKEDYIRWFDTLSPAVRERVCGAWGRPPGEKMGAIPPAMVYDGKIVITGVRYGNAVVCVQPKRGCAGARCDGQVCKILHDPDVPPTHQYLATYRYLEDVFGADVLIHVGTHGNLEFLPGKGVGLSKDCYPDIAIGTIPHLYIYNADNPPEGTIAKRRSYAALVDHMQTVLTGSGLYDELLEVDRLLGDYETARFDPARAHALEHLLVEAIKKANLDKEIKLREGMALEEIVKKAHEALSRIRNTQIQSGMHIFGELPEGEKRIDFINSILRYDSGGVSLRREIASMMGLSLDMLLKDQGAVSESYGRSNGQLLEDIDARAKSLIKAYLSGDGQDPGQALGLPVAGHEKALAQLKLRVVDLNGRIERSNEMGSLLNGLSGGYIPAGPSGLITRGRDDILPTGRNFYSLDPYRVPTRAAWKVGQMLARSIIDKHAREEGRIPENIAFYWMCSDIMWADGEDMAQIMYLLGVEPVWQPNGRLKGFRVVPLSELGRPRIDVTIRVSGITRDNFPNCIEVIDEAIQAVASLDEPLDMNYPRKHSLAQMEAGTAGSWRDATLRIFSSKPGTYSAGVNLAVYASAWKDEKDLSDIFVYWNGYAYGKGVSGKESHQQLVDSLKTVDVTYNKVVSDEYDLFGCCCYFSAHGGMTAAARHYSGRDVKAYYGDTREPEHVEVRDLADEVRRVVRTKLLNPKWIEGMKEHGYKGAGDMMKRIGRVYGWEATTQEVDDWIFDDITKTFVLDEEMRRFFEENNPWALEEIARRLLEASQRGLWNANPDLLEKLKEAYLEIEGWMEEKAGDGEYQGGSIDIMAAGEVDGWAQNMQAVMEKIRR